MTAESSDWVRQFNEHRERCGQCNKAKAYRDCCSLGYSLYRKILKAKRQ